jgi:predicted site-specific integrase-resolvase
MQLTTEPVEAGNTSQTLPEFGRVNDVQKIFGVKRGILYRWINEGKIKSVCIREPGNQQGVRLIHLQSVREYINSQMQIAMT